MDTASISVGDLHDSVPFSGRLRSEMSEQIWLRVSEQNRSVSGVQIAPNGGDTRIIH